MPDLTTAIEILTPPEGQQWTPADVTLLQTTVDNELGRFLDALGGPNLRPQANFATVVPTTGMGLSCGGSGQSVIAQGRILDTCPATPLTVATAGGSDRIDLIAIQATRVTGSTTITRMVRSDSATPQLAPMGGTLVAGTATVPLLTGYTVAPKIIGPFPIGVDSTANIHLVSVSTTQAVFSSDDSADTRSFSFLVAGTPTGSLGVSTSIPLYENQPAWAYVQNTSGTPLVAPAPPSGYDAYATVYVHASETSISSGDIAYLFPQIPPLNMQLVIDGLQVLTNATIDGAFTVDGATTLAAAILSSLTVTGNTILGGTLTLGGLASLGGSVNVGAALTVAGATNLNSTLAVLGASTLAALTATTTTLSSLTVSGSINGTTATFSGLLTGANVNLTGLLAVTGNETVSGTLGVTGLTTGSSAAYTGAITAGSATAPAGPAAGDLQASRSVSTGAVIFGGTSSNASIDYGINHAAAFTIIAALYSGELFGSSAITAGWLTAPSSPAAGDLQASRSTTTGALVLGGSSSSAVLDYGVNNAGAFTLGAALHATGAITATQFNGSGAGLTSGTIPTAALVSIPIGGVVPATVRISGTSGQTLAIGSALPAGNWSIFATATVTVASGTMTLTGGGSGVSWESPGSTTSQNLSLMVVQLQGTATGGQTPSIALTYSAGSFSPSGLNYVGCITLTCTRTS